MNFPFRAHLFAGGSELDQGVKSLFLMEAFFLGPPVGARAGPS
jgi:hypothetical protein